MLETRWFQKDYRTSGWILTKYGLKWTCHAKIGLFIFHNIERSGSKVQELGKSCISGPKIIFTEYQDIN